MKTNATYFVNDEKEPLRYGKINLINPPRQRLRGEEMELGIEAVPVFCGFCGTDFELMKMGRAKNLSKKLGVKNNIEFLGILSADEMKNQLLSSHIYVMPSCIENSPNTLGEAMVLGTPSIASFVGGVVDLGMHNDDLLMYRYEDVEVLAAYIDKILSDDNYAMELSMRSRVNAIKLHDKDKIVKDMIDIYESIRKK